MKYYIGHKILLCMGGGDMDAKSCAAFLRTADRGSITKAAFALGYTQAGVSLIVKKIEEECGFPLLIREKDGVRLTPEGERMVPVMREIVRWNERFYETAEEIKGVSVGRVRIGCYSSVSYHLMPPVIREFHKDYPKIEIDVLEGDVHEIERWLEENRVDVGFLSARRGQKFRYVKIMRDPILAVLPPGHPMCGAETFPLKAFGDGTFIVNDIEDSHPVIKAYEEQYGPMPDMKISSTDQSVISMAACGLGVSTYPALQLLGHGEGVVTKRIDPPFFRTVIMGLRPEEELSPAARRFLDYIKKYLPELTKSGEPL